MHWTEKEVASAELCEKRVEGLKLFYFDLEPMQSFLIVAEDEDEAYKKLEEHVGSVYVSVVVEVGCWKKIKEKLNKEKIVEVL